MPLLNTNQIAGRIAKSAIANAVWLFGRLLNDLSIAGFQPRKEVIKVIGGQNDSGVSAFCHHFGNGIALIVGDARIRSRRMQDDGSVGLAGRANRDPTHPLIPNIIANLEAEDVTIEGQGSIWIVVWKKTRMNRNAHMPSF